MRTLITLITLLVATVGCTYTVSANDLYKSNLGVSWGDTTIKGFGFSKEGWWTTGEDYLKRYEKKKGITLFDLQSDITRYGDTAFFIQAPGDECFQRPADCDRVNGEKQKRVEAKLQSSFKGMVWLSYSFMIPDSYELNDSRKAIVQFHSDYDYFGPMFLLQLEEDGLIWTHESGGGHLIVPGGTDDCAAGAGGKNDTHKRQYCEARMDSYQLIKPNHLKRNVWYDVVFNINFDNKKLDKAYHKIWINGELVHERHNQTLWLKHKGLPSKFMKATFNFGIYGTYKDRSYQALYADEIHFGKKCNKLLLENLGYDCKQLEAQEIEESQPYWIEDRANYYTTGEVKYIKKPLWK
tara:strand:+ start:196 stop:1251 length:1056 start_codon:yes stop_codon:yes gene_type:complete